MCCFFGGLYHQISLTSAFIQKFVLTTSGLFQYLNFYAVDYKNNSRSVCFVHTIVHQHIFRFWDFLFTYKNKYFIHSNTLFYLNSYWIWLIVSNCIRCSDCFIRYYNCLLFTIAVSLSAVFKRRMFAFAKLHLLYK